MTKEDKKKIIEPLTRNFETEEIKLWFMDMVGEIPDYIFTMKASTTAKYHNAQQCETHGQLIHAFMFDSILNHLLRLKGNREKFPTPEERDCMRCCPVLHDAVKCGWNGSKYSVANHPMLAKEWILSTEVEHKIPTEYRQMVADCCEAHSGEWNKSKSGKVLMSEPRNEREFLIHMCDILSSRPDINYDVPDELMELMNMYAKEELPDINEYVLTFGKHKGKTLIQVNAEDPSYIKWAKENMTMEPAKSLLREM